MLTLKYALNRESADNDDEYLDKYRDCGDADKDPDGSRYETDVNNAFIPYIKYTPCDIKNMPEWRDEHEYSDSLIDYALSINPDFEYETMTKTFFMASQGTFDKADLADEQAEEIKGLEFQLEQLQTLMKRVCK